jgi:hypothetical protein
VASLQEQAGADVVLKTLGTGLHPRRSKSLATFCSPVIAACSFRDALMLTGNVTDDDASMAADSPLLRQPIAHAVTRQEAYEKQLPVGQGPIRVRSRMHGRPAPINRHR